MNKPQRPETREDTMSELDFVSGLFLAPNTAKFLREERERIKNELHKQSEDALHE